MTKLLLCTTAAVGTYFAKSSSINDQEQEIVPNMTRDQLLNVHERFYLKIIGIYCIILYSYFIVPSVLCLLPNCSLMRFRRTFESVTMRWHSGTKSVKSFDLENFRKLIKMFSNKHKKCYLGKKSKICQLCK